MTQPPTVQRAVRLLVLLVLLAGVVTALTVVLHEALLDSWAVGRPAAADVEQPSFVPVAVVLFVVFAGLVGVLVPFLRAGADWARHALASVVLLAAIATVAALRTGPPAPFVVAAILALVVDVALLVQLWHPATSAFVKDHEPAGAVGAGPGEPSARRP